MEDEALDWLTRLEQRLDDQVTHAQFYDRHYSGEATLKIVEDDFREVFGPYKVEPPRTNICAVAVEGVAERLVIDGFRVGDDDDQAAAAAALDLYRRNDLEAMQPIGHRETFVKGASFLLLGWDDERAIITVEDAEQVAVIRRQIPPYDVIAAVKRWTDEWDGLQRAEVMLEDDLVKDLGGDPVPGGIHRFREVPKRRRMRTAGGKRVKWERDDSQVDDSAGIDDEGYSELHEGLEGAVPVIELADRQRLLKPPRSRLVDVVPLAVTHQKLLADLVLAATFGAIPIRTAAGIKFPRDENDNIIRDSRGLPAAPIDVRADRLMASEDPAARFGTLAASDLAGYVAAIDAVLKEARTVTRLPLHYFGTGAAANTSAAALKSAESSLERSVGGIQPGLGSSWSTAIRLGLQIEGSDHAGKLVTAKWRDMSTRVEAELTDQATKLHSIEVPLEVVLEKFMDQPTIKRVLKLRDAEKLRAAQLLKAVQNDALGDFTIPTLDDDEPDDDAGGIGDGA